MLKNKVSKVRLFNYLCKNREMSLRRTASPLTMITLNEGQRKGWEKHLFKVGFKRICSWMNWREGHTVHMYVHATHDQTNTPESWTMKAKDEIYRIRNEQPDLEELPEDFWPDTPTKMEV